MAKREKAGVTIKTIPGMRRGVGALILSGMGEAGFLDIGL